MLMNSIYQCFVEDFYINNHKDIGLLFSFLVFSMPDFGIWELPQKMSWECSVLTFFIFELEFR